MNSLAIECRFNGVQIKKGMKKITQSYKQPWKQSTWLSNTWNGQGFRVTCCPKAHASHSRHSVCLPLCCHHPFPLVLSHEMIAVNCQLWNCLQTKFLLLWTKIFFFQVLNLLCIFSSHLKAIPASSTPMILPFLPVKRLCEKAVLFPGFCSL